MLASITWQQFREWMVFAELEPFDEERDDLRAAQVTAAIYNVNRDVKKRPEPFQPTEVRLRFGDAPEEKRLVQKTWQQMKSIGRMMYQAMGQSDKKGRK